MTGNEDRVHIETTDVSPEVRDRIVREAREYVPAFAAAEDGALCVSQVSGGITNSLYLVANTAAAEAAEPRRALVRIFGENTELLIDRARESFIFHFFESKGLAPHLYAEFPCGRVEEFLRSRTFGSDDIRDPRLSALVARKLAEMHALQPSGPGLHREDGSSLFPTLWKWLDQALQVTLQGKDQTRLESLQLNAMKEQVQWLQSTLESDEFKSPVVLCHNDLLAGNILIRLGENDEELGLTFIDYEYCSYSHRYESSGFDGDFSKYPTMEEQLAFLRAYREAAGLSTAREDVEKMQRKVDAFSVASHLYWGLWAVVQASSSSIDFDFLEYCQMRFKMFFACKERVFAK